VVTDCVGGSTQARHLASLDAMEYLQAGACRDTEEILAAFAALAPTPSTMDGQIVGGSTVDGSTVDGRVAVAA
jgi:hypothetical protein